MPKSAHTLPYTHRPFLRRQESHSVVCHNSPPKRRRRWRQMKERFLPSQEWSTWGLWFVGGFWYCRRRQIVKLSPALSPKSADNSPYTSRPFLRRQESHSVVSAQLPNPPPIPIPPEDHSCEGRNLTIVCRQRRRKLRRRCRPWL